MNTLIIIIVLYLIIRFSAKYLMPYLVKRYLNKIKQRFEEQNPNSSNFESPNKINIKHSSNNIKKEDLDVEYTDFEEIKDPSDSSNNK